MVAVDADAAEVKDCAAVMAAMAADDRRPGARDRRRRPRLGRRRPRPALRRRPHSTGSSQPRCSSTSPTTGGAMAELARVLRPGGTMAVTVPRWLPELVIWALSDDYHPCPAATSASTGRAPCWPACPRPACIHSPATTPTPCTAPYWWLRCLRSASATTTNRLVRAYHRLLVWDITTGLADPAPRSAAQPGAGQVAGHLPRTGRHEAHRSRDRRRPRTGSPRCSWPTG